MCHLVLCWRCQTMHSLFYYLQHLNKVWPRIQGAATLHRATLKLNRATVKRRQFTGRQLTSATDDRATRHRTSHSSSTVGGTANCSHNSSVPTQPCRPSSPFLQATTGVSHPSARKYRALNDRIARIVAAYGCAEVLVYLLSIACLSHA